MNNLSHGTQGEQCIHEMNPDVCGFCNGMKTPEEEQREIERDWNLVDTGESCNHKFCCAKHQHHVIPHVRCILR